LESIPRGLYAYDAVRHALVRRADPDPEWTEVGGDWSAGFLITSRVERAMWRYRDLRALRPVLLDAGHIIETLGLLLGLWGLAVSVTPPLHVGGEDFSWLEEPELALILAGRPRSTVTLPRLSLGPASVVQGMDGSQRLLTNPGFYMQFVEGGLQGHSLWPRRRSVFMESTDFQIVNHCLPSKRGDRITTPDGILAAIPGSSRRQIDALREAGALLPEELCKAFHRGAELWSRYDWYLSLLAHLEARASHRRSPSTVRLDQVTRLPAYDRDSLVRALLTRVTTRAFSERPVGMVALRQVLEALALNVPATLPALRILVAALAVDELPPGVYEWDPSVAELRDLNIRVDREAIRRMTIGQKPAGDGAFVVWVCAEVKFDPPMVYELAALDLGRMGQRLCLTATALGLGVFLTPAVSDDTTFETLGLPDKYRSFVYLFSVGHKRE
jgi:nitroreductase